MYLPQLALQCLMLMTAIKWCQSGRFYCRPRSALTVFIGRSSHTRQPDNFVIDEDLEPELLNSTNRRCSWVLELDSPTPRQVVMRGIQRSSLADSRQKRSILSSNNCEFRLTSSAVKTCRLIQSEEEKTSKLSEATLILRSMSVRTQLTLSMDLPPEKPSVAIAVSVIEPEYCAQNMVLHNGKCHAVIEQQNSSLTDVMQIISSSSSAGMQLASFNSLEEIRIFIKQNYEPEFDLPPKQPMDLTKPVRIGLFYSMSSNSVFECIATREKGCELKKHLNSTEFISAAKILDGPCGALHSENSKSPVISFCNCNQQMPSLISFPETPENATCTDCDGEINKWLKDEKWLRNEKLHVQTTESVYSNASVTIVTAGASMLLLGVVAFLSYFFCRRKFTFKMRSNSYTEKESDVIEEREVSIFLDAIEVDEESEEPVLTEVPDLEKPRQAMRSNDVLVPPASNRWDSDSAKIEYTSSTPTAASDAPLPKKIQESFKGAGDRIHLQNLHYHME